MEHLATFQFFASHNAFDVYDSADEPWNEPSECDGLAAPEQTKILQRGWYRRGRSIVYRTLVDSYVNRIDFYRSAVAPGRDEAERVLVHNLSVPSGAVTIFSLDSGETVNIGAGDYSVYCRAFNLGVDLELEEIDADPQAYFTRTDMERFELIFVPGRVEVEGLIHGRATLWP